MNNTQLQVLSISQWQPNMWGGAGVRQLKRKVLSFFLIASQPIINLRHSFSGPLQHCSQSNIWDPRPSKDGEWESMMLESMVGFPFPTL